MILENHCISNLKLFGTMTLTFKNTSASAKCSGILSAPEILALILGISKLLFSPGNAWEDPPVYLIWCPEDVSIYNVGYCMNNSGSRQ